VKKLQFVIIAALALALPGPGGAASIQVTISATAFTPKNLTVNYGDTVKWKNADKVNHQLVADNGAFASPILRPGDWYPFTWPACLAVLALFAVAFWLARKSIACGGLAWVAAGTLPIIPLQKLSSRYLYLPAAGWSIVLCGVVVFGIGVFKSRWTRVDPIRSGLEVVALAAFAGIAGYLFGSVLPSVLGFAGLGPL